MTAKQKKEPLTKLGATALVSGYLHPNGEEVTVQLSPDVAYSATEDWAPGQPMFSAQILVKADVAAELFPLGRRFFLGLVSKADEQAKEREEAEKADAKARAKADDNTKEPQQEADANAASAAAAGG